MNNNNTITDRSVESPKSSVSKMPFEQLQKQYEALLKDYQRTLFSNHPDRESKLLMLDQTLKELEQALPEVIESKIGKATIKTLELFFKGEVGSFMKNYILGKKSIYQINILDHMGQGRKLLPFYASEIKSIENLFNPTLYGKEKITYEDLFTKLEKHLKSFRDEIKVVKENIGKSKNIEAEMQKKEKAIKENKEMPEKEKVETIRTLSKELSHQVMLVEGLKLRLENLKEKEEKYSKIVEFITTSKKEWGQDQNLEIQKKFLDHLLFNAYKLSFSEFSSSNMTALAVKQHIENIKQFMESDILVLENFSKSIKRMEFYKFYRWVEKLSLSMDQQLNQLEKKEKINWIASIEKEMLKGLSFLHLKKDAELSHDDVSGLKEILLGDMFKKVTSIIFLSSREEVETVINENIELFDLLEKHSQKLVKKIIAIKLEMLKVK